MEEKKKFVDILPIGKGKRILLFLADFFLNFIFAFVIFNVVIYPLAKVATGYPTKNDNYFKDLDNRATVLYENKILFDSGDVEKREIVYNASFTCYVYLSYYCFDEESPALMKKTQFGHKTENEVFLHYYKDIIADEESYYSVFDSYNEKYGYFERVGDVITLKNEVREQVKTFYRQNEEVTNKGQEYIDQISDSLFYPIYGEVMTLVEKNDLHYNELSYNKVQSQIKGFETYIVNMVTYTSFISVFLSSLIYFFILPIFNSNKRTLAMMLMKVERVSIQKFLILKKKDIFISFIYQFLMSFVICFFIPMTILGFFEIFKLSVVLIFGLFSILLMLGSMIFLFVNSFNKTMFDYFSRCIYLSSDELDDIYKARGYIV